MARPRRHAALGATSDITAEAPLLNRGEDVAPRDLFLTTVVPADAQKLLIAIRGLANDVNDHARCVAAITADYPVADSERDGGHGGSIS